MLYRCGRFLLVTLVRFNCARNSSEHRQLSIGLTRTLAIEPNEGNTARLCGCIMSLTSSPWVPFSCVLAFSSLQVGLARCVLRLMLVFAVPGWFRRFCLPPPPLVLSRFPSASGFLFFSLAFPGLPVLG